MSDTEVLRMAGVVNTLVEARPAVDRVVDELVRQHDKWGEQNHPDGTGRPYDRGTATAARSVCERAAAAGRLTWREILLEEVAEALAEDDEDLLGRELEQVAAVAVQWRTAIARRQAAR